jgi:hypothetical protein
MGIASHPTAQHDGWPGLHLHPTAIPPWRRHLIADPRVRPRQTQSSRQSPSHSQSDGRSIRHPARQHGRPLRAVIPDSSCCAVVPHDGPWPRATPDDPQKSARTPPSFAGLVAARVWPGVGCSEIAAEPISRSGWNCCLGYPVTARASAND